MTNYDFKILQPIEFECLTRDIIQARDKVFIESFTEGRDGGIDFRYAVTKDKTAVIQAKRYASYKSLLTVLKKEAEKVKKLSPTRYYISTSVGLTPGNKDEIQSLFGENILNTEDILGKDDLNNLLGLHPEIEKQYYKLWLSSTSVLERIMKKKIRNWAQFEMDKIMSDIHQYVENESVHEALNILNEHKYVIISGIPGIGKTTLARMLVYRMLANDIDEFVFIPSDIDDAVDMFEEERAQVFFFDDFLGSTVFEKGERKFDQKILSFIEKVKRSKNKYFILTTREYILSEAMLTYECFVQRKIDIAKCTLDLHHYTKFIKASILYNHLADANIPASHINNLLENRNYLKLIDHKNFNPRVIEAFINERIWENVKPENFVSKLLSFFDKPFNVWQYAFERLEMSMRYSLLVLLTMPTPVRTDSWKEAFDHFCETSRARLGLFCDEQKWRNTQKILMDSFINIKKLEETMIVDFFNPSVKDFLCSYLMENKDTCRAIFNGLYFTEQLYTLFSDSTTQKFYYWAGSSYIQVGVEQYDEVKQKVKELRNHNRTCLLKRDQLLTSKIVPYDELKFLLKIGEKFPIICRDNPGFLEEFVTQQMLEDNNNSVDDRLKLMKQIDFDNTTDVDTGNAITKMQYDLGNLAECVEYAPMAIQYNKQDLIYSTSFQITIKNLILNEIDSISTEEDLGAVEDDIAKLVDLIPLCYNDFEDKIDDKRSEIQQYENDNDDDWENSRYYGQIKEEENRINEMFTSLRTHDDEA